MRIFALYIFMYTIFNKTTFVFLLHIPSEHYNNIMERTSVTCAVIVKNGMILAANRGNMVNHAGRWEFPGGKLQKDETYEQCVVRRVSQELGLNIRILETLKSFEVKENDDKIYEMHPFIAEVVDGRAVLTNHSRAEWFLPIQLMRLAWPQTDMPIIEEIISRIMTNGKII